MTFTDFVCLFLVGPGRRAADGEDGGRSTRPGALADPAGGGGRRGPAAAKPAGERRQDSGDPRTNTKTAVGRRECTGPQPFGQNTSLNPNLAQLSSSSRPNHT